MNINNPNISPDRLEIKINNKALNVNKKIKLLIFIIVSTSFSLIVYGIILKSNKEKLQVLNQQKSNHKLVRFYFD